MSLENKGNVVIDLKNKSWLKEDDKKKIIESGVTERNLDSFSFGKFDEAIEKSFQNFLKTIKINSYDSKETIQMQFNNWLDDECKELDIIKDTEIDEKIIKPVSFELVKEATRTELEDLQKELLEAEKKKTEASVDITVNEGELKWLTKLYNGVTKQEVVNLLGKDFDWRKHLLDLLKVKNSDNIKKFQRIVAGIDETNSSKDKDPETLKKLGWTWVDWMFWQHTLKAFKKYIGDNLVETKQNSWVVQQWSDNLPMGDAWSEWFKDSWVMVGEEFQPIVTDKMPAQNNLIIEQYENSINNLQNIDKSKAAEIVKFATENKREAINLGGLKNLTKEVARELAKFKWTINMSWLEEVSEDVLVEFSKWNCTMVQFPCGTLNNNDDEISIILRNGTTYSKITSGVCGLLVNKVATASSLWGSSVIPGWFSSTTQAAATQQGSWTTTWNKTGWSSTQPASNEALSERWGMAMWEHVPLSSLTVEQKQQCEKNKGNVCDIVLNQVFDQVYRWELGVALWLLDLDLGNDFASWSKIILDNQDMSVKDFLTKLREWSINYRNLNADIERSDNLANKTHSADGSELYFPVIQNIKFSEKVQRVVEQREYSWTWKEVAGYINKEFEAMGIGSPIKVIADTSDTSITYFSIPKDLSNIRSLSVLYDPKLKKYIKTVDGDQNAFAIPTNIKIWLIKDIPNILVIWDYEKKDWFLSLDESSNLIETPSEYPWKQNPSFKVTEYRLGGLHENGGNSEASNTGTYQYVSEWKNEYHNLEDDNYWEALPEKVFATNYEAIINYMKWEKNKNLVQAFQRLKINPNSIANALSQILNDNPDIDKWSFKREHIKDWAMNQLWRNGKWFVNEKNQLVKILNSVGRKTLDNFIREMKVFNNVRVLQKTKKFVEMNEKNICKNPFLVLSDFNRSGDIGRWEKWLKHEWRTSEQAMYNIFVLLADTKDDRWIKKIIDWPKTIDLVKWFISMIKSAWDGRYQDIEDKFGGNYTMENLWNYMVEHAETIVLYQQTLNYLSYNPSIDISSIVSYSRRQSIVDSKMQDIEQLSTNRDDVQKWFNKQLENKEFKEQFEKLSAEEQKNLLWNLAWFLGEHWLVREIVWRFWVSSKTWVTVDSLDAVKFEWHVLKDNNWIWPRFSFGPIENGAVINLDVPLVNLTGKFDLNRSGVESAVIHWVTPVHQLYTRLWANMIGSVSFPKGKIFDIDEWQAYLSAAIEGAVWWSADYKKGIELWSRSFWNILENEIFYDPDFTSVEWFREKAKQKIEDILNSKSKEKVDKNLRKFMKNNKNEMYNCIDNVSAMLSSLWAFDPGKDIAHKYILLNSIMKWVVESVKDQNLWELDWKSKLTSFWIWWQYWVFLNLKELKNVRSWDDFKKVCHLGRKAWIEATVSSWNMIYSPDKEKLEYMDDKIKSWESIKSLGEGIRTNNLENIKKAIEESLSQNWVPMNVKSNDRWQIEISITDEVLQKYGKNNIYELFNIYVNPNNKKNIAITPDGKTLILGWNDLKSFSVATRNYFDEFAIYLMIWGKWITACGNNKIDSETLGEYSTLKHVDSVPWFEFEQQITQRMETEESIISSVLSESQITSWFRSVENALSKIDDQKWNDYVEFMESTCDLDWNFIENSDYEDAFSNLVNMIKASISSGKLNPNIKSDIENVRNEINKITDFDQKVFVVDRFKMIFSLISWTDSKEWLQKLAKKRSKTYESLKWYATNGDEFPLAGKSYRDKLISSLWNGKVDRKPDSNLVGMTAFYKRGHRGTWENPNELIWQQLVQAYGYSMTEIWWTDYLWTLYGVEQEDLNNTKEWFINNLNASQVHKNLLKKVFSDKIWNNIDDTQLFKLLKWEEIEINIDKWVKKIKIDAKYVFYLLWECANESIGVKLWSLKIITEIPHEELIPVEADDILDVWVDWQTLTKTSSLNQNDMSVKIDLLHGSIEPETDPETTETPPPPTVDPSTTPVIPDAPSVSGVTTDPDVIEPINKVPKEKPWTPSQIVTDDRDRRFPSQPKEWPWNASQMITEGRDDDIPSPDIGHIVENR